MNITIYRGVRGNSNGVPETDRRKVGDRVAKAERKKPIDTGKTTSLDFESRFDKLNANVAELESGRLSLDESLKAYRDGIDLVGQCRAILEQAQARVESIENIEESGVIVSEPLDLETESHEALRSAETAFKTGDEPF